jgi:transposase
MEAYSLDLRKRVLASCDAGRGTKQVAELYGVSTAWVRRLKQRRRELGLVGPLPGRFGKPPKLTDEHLRRLEQLVAHRPDATLAELRDELGVQVVPSTIARALARLGLTFKKSRSTPPSRTAQTSRPGGPSGTSSSST